MNKAEKEKFACRAYSHFNRKKQFWRHAVLIDEFTVLILRWDSGLKWMHHFMELERLPPQKP